VRTACISVTVLLQIVGWIITFSGAFLAGFGTLPEWYLATAGHIAPGERIGPDSLAMTQADYLREFAIDAGMMVFGLLVNDGAVKLRRVLLSGDSKSQI
jgi:hypothetical protein